MKQMGKRLCRISCFFLACVCLLTLFVGCEKAPGIYAWYGGKMKADTILRLTVDLGDGAKSYEVPFETYRTVFLYLKGIVSDETPLEGAETDEDDDSSVQPTRLATKKEQTLAVKEVAEQVLTEYYSLIVLGESLGVSITESDRAAFEEDHRKTIENYLQSIETSGVEYDGTAEEYAEYLYERSLAAASMTVEYYEFSYFRDLLEKKIKLAVSTDLQDYLNQTFFHYKQVVAVYTKGDSAAEAEARARITAARLALQNGADMDEVIAQYGNYAYDTELYFDVYGSIVGSASGDTVDSITSNAVRALENGELSDIISGEEGDEDCYFAVFCRLPVEAEFVCGGTQTARIMYQYPYVNAESFSTYYTRYELLVESVMQNMICEPVSEKVYRRIAVNTLF